MQLNAMHTIVIEFTFTKSLLIKSMTVTDFMNCVKWCGSRTASICMCRRLKLPQNFPLALMALTEKVQYCAFYTKTV